MQIRCIRRRIHQGSGGPARDDRPAIVQFFGPFLQGVGYLSEHVDGRIGVPAAVSSRSAGAIVLKRALVAERVRFLAVMVAQPNEKGMKFIEVAGDLLFRGPF